MATQIVCIGDSMSYGSGSTMGGWPDILKHELHRRMYGPSNEGSAYEVYNLSVPGRTTEHALQHAGAQIASIKKPDSAVIIVFSLGMNDSKAKEQSNTYVSTPEAYGQRITQLLNMFNEQQYDVVAFGFTPVNEQLTNPKMGYDGTATFFTNERIKAFEQTFQQAATATSTTFIPLFDTALNSTWPTECLYKDGLHANAIGQQWIYEKIIPQIEKILASQ